jgi:hypothetical protein
MNEDKHMPSSVRSRPDLPRLVTLQKKSETPLIRLQRAPHIYAPSGAGRNSAYLDTTKSFGTGRAGELKLRCKDYSTILNLPTRYNSSEDGLPKRTVVWRDAVVFKAL